MSIVRAYPSDVFIVFCNTVPSCDWTAYYLRSNDVPVVKLHAGFSSKVLYTFLPSLRSLGASRSDSVITLTDSLRVCRTVIVY